MIAKDEKGRSEKNWAKREKKKRERRRSGKDKDMGV